MWYSLRNCTSIELLNASWKSANHGPANRPISVYCFCSKYKTWRLSFSLFLCPFVGHDFDPLTHINGDFSMHEYREFDDFILFFVSLRREYFLHFIKWKHLNGFDTHKKKCNYKIVHVWMAECSVLGVPAISTFRHITRTTKESCSADRLDGEHTTYYFIEPLVVKLADILFMTHFVLHIVLHSRCLMLMLM